MDFNSVEVEPELIVPTNSHSSPPGGFTQRVNEPVLYPPSTATLPSGLKNWWSNQVFKIVTFFVLMSAVLTVTTIAFFNGKLTSDQYLGIISSLLFLSTPSPLQNAKKKQAKVYYVNGPPPV